MLTATSGFKTNVKSVACYSNGKFDLKYDATTVSFDNDDIISMEIFGSAIQNDKVLGNLAQHSLTIVAHGNLTSSIDLSKDNYIEPYIGVLVSGSYEWIKQQTFLVTEIKYNDTNNQTTLVCTDYLYKLNKEFVDSNTYPMTLKAYLESVLTYCGLSLQNTTFLNSTFSVASMPVPDYTSCKEIVSRVAELALCFVVINKTNDKVELRSAFDKQTTHADLASYTHTQLASYTHAQLTNLDTSSVEVLTKDNYYSLKLYDHNFGINGINTLVLKISQVTGENDSKENATNVAIDGAVEVVIEDNPFINTSALRLSVIDDMFAAIDGTKFYPYSLEYRGFPYLELGDIFTVEKMDNLQYSLPIYEYSIKYNGGLKGNLTAKALNKTQTSYKWLSNSYNKARTTEIRVDKVESDIILQADEITILANSKEDAFYKQATQPFANMVTGGGFEAVTGWTPVNITNTYASGIATLTATASGGRLVQTKTLVVGRKYYFGVFAKHDSTSVSHRLYSGTTAIVFLTGVANSTYTLYSNVGTADSTSGEIQIGRDGRASAWTTQYADDVYLIDLTATYGAGLEPTKAEMDLIIKRSWLDTTTNTYKSFRGQGWIPSSTLTGSKYVFDGQFASFYSDGLKLYDNSVVPVLKVYFDTVNARYVFNGEIQATTGNISGNLTVGTTSINAGLSGSGTASTSIRIWAGYATPNTAADFYVRDDGYAKIANATIAGWTINSSSIYKGAIKLDATNERIYLNTSAYFTNGASASDIYLVGNILPESTHPSLGTSTQYFGSSYFSNIYPYTNGGTTSLGSTTLRWGDVWCTDGAFNGSDIRLKKDVMPIEKGVELILKLEPVQYKWKEKKRYHYGLIANQVKEVFDELGIDSGVYADPSASKDYDKKDDPNAYLALRYTELIAPLIQTVQYLKQEIDLLKNK